MAEDLVKLARQAFKACRPVDRVACQDFGMQQDDILDQQLAAALAATHAYYAAIINTQAASLAAKDKEIERLRAVDPRTSLLTVIADIREKTGVGGKPMLDELADAIAEKLTSKERALAEAVEVMRRCENALSRCYNVTEWPADGSTDQDKAAESARAFVAQHGSDSREGRP